MVTRFNMCGDWGPHPQQVLAWPPVAFLRIRKKGFDLSVSHI